MAVADFGLSLPVVQQVPGNAQAWEAEAGEGALVPFARTAERLGYRYVSCSDHVLVPASRAAVMGETWYEPATTLAFVAGATGRIGLLTHVLVLAYRHPLVTARTWATLDRLSGGRVILGVGSGHLKPEFRILGAPFEDRGRVTDEAIAAIRASWRDEVAAFDGETVRFHDVIVSPRPARPGGPPVWVGGNGSRALRRAALLGDGWVPWQLEIGEFAEAVREGKRLREGAGKAGSFEWIAPLRVIEDSAAGDLRALVARWREAGATGFHAGVQGRTLEETLGRLEWFATEVANRA